MWLSADRSPFHPLNKRLGFYTPKRSRRIRYGCTTVLVAFTGPLLVLPSSALWDWNGDKVSPASNREGGREGGQGSRVGSHRRQGWFLRDNFTVRFFSKRIFLTRLCLWKKKMYMGGGGGERGVGDTVEFPWFRPGAYCIIDTDLRSSPFFRVLLYCCCWRRGLSIGARLLR